MELRMSLSNRVAIITGSGQGIGREIALMLSELGASVVAEIEAKNGKSLAIPVNVTIAAEVNKLVEQALSSFGHIDILVNNAGVTRDGLLLRMSEADWDLVLNINLKGAFICTQAVLRHMIRQRWGRIVNMASVVGLTGNAGQANYSASKAGLIGLTKSTAREVASRGITVNAVAPGFIDTGMTQKLSDNVKQELLKQIPVGFIGLPKDVAYAVAFLVSEEAHYITGQVINVNGGMAMI
jgi:3-oxoacyl-[acyl-carrier protein] reductase